MANPADEVSSAYSVVENWRISHAMPLLTSRVALTQRARRVDENAIVAQRLKLSPETLKEA